MRTKHCNSCNISKDVSLFGKDKHSKDMLTRYCKECRNKRQVEYAKANPDFYKKKHVRNIEYKRKYYLLPEVKRRTQNQQLKKSFGIGIEDYDKMLESQNGVCGICLNPQNSSRNKNFAVDHCHQTGKIRGLLCDRCNRGLGLFNDKIDILTSAINYLKQQL